MKKIIVLLLLFAFSPLIFAQLIPEFKVKFGEYNVADIEMKSYEKDSSVDAVVLAGDRIFIQPLLWKTQHSNPFTKAERQYLVDLGYNIQEMVIGKYTIPIITNSLNYSSN